MAAAWPCAVRNSSSTRSGTPRLFCRTDLLERHLSKRGRQWLGSHLQQDHPWEINAYVPVRTSLRQRVLAPWVAVRAAEEIRLAAAFGLRKVIPCWMNA